MAQDVVAHEVVEIVAYVVVVRDVVCGVVVYCVVVSDVAVRDVVVNVGVVYVVYVVAVDVADVLDVSVGDFVTGETVAERPRTIYVATMQNLNLTSAALLILESGVWVLLTLLLSWLLTLLC